MKLTYKNEIPSNVEHVSYNVPLTLSDNRRLRGFKKKCLELKADIALFAIA